MPETNINNNKKQSTIIKSKYFFKFIKFNRNDKRLNSQIRKVKKENY